jgi:hypothetical protein
LLLQFVRQPLQRPPPLQQVLLKVLVLHIPLEVLMTKGTC